MSVGVVSDLVTIFDIEGARQIIDRPPWDGAVQFAIEQKGWRQRTAHGIDDAIVARSTKPLIGADAELCAGSAGHRQDAPLRSDPARVDRLA